MLDVTHTKKDPGQAATADRAARCGIGLIVRPSQGARGVGVSVEADVGQRKKRLSIEAILLFKISIPSRGQALHQPLSIDVVSRAKVVEIFAVIAQLGIYKPDKKMWIHGFNVPEAHGPYVA